MFAIERNALRAINRSHLKEKTHITYNELSITTGMGRRTIARNIAELKDKGILERVGEDKNGYWKLNLWDVL